MNRILSPLRILSPGRNQRNDPNLKAAFLNNPIAKEMKRNTSAKNIENALNNNGANNNKNSNFGGTAYGNLKRNSSDKFENMFLRNNTQCKVEINENKRTN